MSPKEGTLVILVTNLALQGSTVINNRTTWNCTRTCSYGRYLYCLV